MRGLRTLALVIVLALVYGLGGLAVAAEQRADTYKGLATVIVIIDGEELVCDVPAVVIDGRTLVPLRAIMEALGGGVRWDAASKTVSVETEPDAEPPASTAAATATTTTTSTEPGGTATTTATPEQLAAALATYEAAVAAAEATRAAANDALYQQYSNPGLPGHFDSEVYEHLYLPALEAVEAAYAAAVAAAAAAYIAAGGTP
jgi:hypothetical protein